MISKFLHFSTLFSFALFTLGSAIGSYENKYNYFDDYLGGLEEQQQYRIIGHPEESEGSGYDPDTHFELNPKFGLKKVRDTCCSLGYLAGEKDYHCIAKFYAARILLRNKNRTRNRIVWNGLRTSTKLMRTFEQCVSSKHQPKIFDMCCRKAAKSRRIKPHNFVTVRRKRYEMKMKRIRMPKIMHDDDHLIIV